MSLNSAPSSERVHIAFFGMRNAGKSSLMNAVINQDLSVVSPVAGTTTDIVRKSMELLPVGPVVMIDTPGLDDEGELGELRKGKAESMIARSDAAVIVLDSTKPVSEKELALISRILSLRIPYVAALNKSDLASEYDAQPLISAGVDRRFIVSVSALEKKGIKELKEKIAESIGREEEERFIVRDLISPGDLVMLVIPVDKAAPKGRLILPQQQTIRDILDGGGRCIAVKEDEVASTISELGKHIRLVITDSQVFGKVSKEVPPSMPLTSFSILFARYKGNLEQAVKGVAAIRTLPDDARILISEGCTHHRQCGDIGTEKIPRWLEEAAGRKHELSFSSGTGFPDDLSPYSLVIHCGGCMLTEREMRRRYRSAEDSGVPMTNYGIFIASVHGILSRALAPFPEILSYLQR